jgi:hypothetical protein
MMNTLCLRRSNTQPHRVYQQNRTLVEISWYHSWIILVLLLGIFRRALHPSATRGCPSALLLPRGCPCALLLPRGRPALYWYFMIPAPYDKNWEMIQPLVQEYNMT